MYPQDATTSMDGASPADTIFMRLIDHCILSQPLTGTVLSHLDSQRRVHALLRDGFCLIPHDLMKPTLTVQYLRHAPWLCTAACWGMEDPVEPDTEAQAAKAAAAEGVR
jgi:hypothetical protein